MPTPLDVDVTEHRQAHHPIDAIFLRRWSPRAMSGEPLTPEEIGTLFEAARWAPSSYNRQPWRFFHASREGEHWERFLGFLVEGNRAWAHRAGLLVVVASLSRTEDGKPHPTHALEAGAAMQNLLLQASTMRLVAHAMRGFDLERARTELGMGPETEPHAMIAVGRPGEIGDLSEKLQARERPSGRRPLAEILIEGPLGAVR